MAGVFVEPLIEHSIFTFLDRSLNHLFSSFSLMSIWLCSRDKIEKREIAPFPSQILITVLDFDR